MTTSESESKTAKLALPVYDSGRSNEKTIVLAHDTFLQNGGAERLFLAALELFNSSPILTLVASTDWKKKLSPHTVHESYLKFLYPFWPRFTYWLPFVPILLKTIKRPPGDVLLSFSSAFIKALPKPKHSIHINYCHTPTRFLWTDGKYVEQEVPLLLQPLARIFLKWMQKWDKRAALRVDHFLCNSKEVQKRIHHFYNRHAKIIYPFVDLDFWKPTTAKNDYFLIAGRLQPHKNNDMVVRICSRLNLTLHVVGEGRDLKRLQKIAGPSVKFFGKISDDALRDQYSSAKAFIYPQLEDFGMMPLEAAGCHTPTLALGLGGALEAVEDGKTGKFFQTESELVDLLKNFDSNSFSDTDFDIWTQKFSKDRFKKELQKYLENISQPALVN